jgi:hypothetical protein
MASIFLNEDRTLNYSLEDTTDDRFEVRQFVWDRFDNIHKTTDVFDGLDEMYETLVLFDLTFNGLRGVGNTNEQPTKRSYLIQ